MQADLRAPDGDGPAWRLSADCEALAWSPAAPAQFLVSSEDGLVAAFDARAGAGAAPLWRLAAHDKPACALAFSAAAPGMLATASTDKKVQAEAGSRDVLGPETFNPESHSPAGRVIFFVGQQVCKRRGHRPFYTRQA